MKILALTLYSGNYSNGYYFFFPASGWRRESDGALRDSGVWGFGWSSTPSAASRAYALEFYSGLAHVDALARNGGFPVRCVQASAAVFAFIKKDIDDTFVFFPASGYRESSGGKLSVSGIWGYGWSSTPSAASRAYALEFYSGIATMYGDYIDCGFPVRCVQGSAAVWAVRKKDIEQIRYRRESGKGILCRRGQADSVTRLERKLSASENYFVCAASSYSISLIKIPVFKCLYFYKHSSGYFLFFPAAGWRHYNDGSLRESGIQGNGWTSTSGGSNSWYLRFLSGVAHMNNNNRGYGLPVRCVQASVLVFVSGIKKAGLFRKCQYIVNDTLVFFPASGYRDFTDGKLAGSGANASGYGWTSTPNGNNVWSVVIWSGGARMDSYSRSDGFPVRCVQASAAVWAVRKENIKQIRYRRESGKGILCRRGQADSVTRLERKLSASENYFVCAAPSYSISLIKLPVFECLYFYKYSSGYFLFFPASGVRSFDTGILYNGGVEGDGWTSSPAVEDRAWYLYFSSGSLWVSVVPRGYGFPVRCVQASANVFVCARKGSKETSGYYPASGYRHNNGTPGGSGSDGRAWTSTLSEGGAYDFGGWNSEIQMFVHSRDYGFPVRCVQGSAAVFVFVRKDSKETFVFFPASGCRVFYNGTVYASAERGYGWASDPYDSNRAWALFLGAAGTNVYYDSRGYAFPVRCVQASATVWAVQKENIKQIRYRRESGKARLCWRGRADSVTRLGRKLSARHSFLPCAVPSYSILLIKIPSLKCLYFYKHSSGYFLFFPASGYRNINDGWLSSSGIWGYGWTSTLDGGNVWHLDIHSGNAYMLSYGRGFGFPVRCVQASVAVFVFVRKDIEKTFVFFPASGYRRNTDGKLYKSGGEGDGWASSSTGGSAFFLRFLSGIAHIQSASRAFGLSVRCVQASATVFAAGGNKKEKINVDKVVI